MNMLSGRFVAAIATLLALAGATITWFTLHPHQQDPCSASDTLGITSLIPGSRHLRLRAELPDAVILWAEGEFTNPISAANPFHYQIVRGYNTLGVSTHALNLVDNEVEGESQRITQIEVDGESLPIHLVEDFTRSPSQLIAYLQIYGMTPTESPIGTHVRSFGSLMLEGAPPVTTIIVDGLVTRKGLPEAEMAMVEWIGGAWTFFARFCPVQANGAG